MRKIAIYIFVLLSVNMFAQESYVFDYCMAYEYKNSEDSSSRSKKFIYVNSSKPGYFLTIDHHLEKESSRVILYDVENNTRIQFVNENSINQDLVPTASLFNSPIKSSYNFSDWNKKVEDKYDIIYQSQDNVNKILIKSYTDSKKNQLDSDIYLILQSHPKLKNQFYVNPALAFAYKFDITQVETQDLVAESYVIKPESNTKEQIWKLIDVKALDLQIDIPAE
jgi:hypothetical protein